MRPQPDWSDRFWLQRHSVWRWVIARWVERRGWVAIFDGSEEEARARLRWILDG